VRQRTTVRNLNIKELAHVRVFIHVYATKRSTGHESDSSSMTELSTIRTEIKSWERTFKESNGRAPTVDDIKQNNTIG